MSLSNLSILVIGFLFIGLATYFFGRKLSGISWYSIEVLVIVSGFIAILAALSQISLTRFEKNISDTVLQAQTDFRRIERSAESGLMGCGLWWNDVGSWDYVPADAPCVQAAGGEATECAVCRIGHMVYQERNTSFGLVSEDSQAIYRGDFLRSDFCHESLTASAYESICPVVTKYSETVETLKMYYETMRTNKFLKFGSLIDPYLQYLLMIVLGLQFGKILVDIRKYILEKNTKWEK